MKTKILLTILICISLTGFAYGMGEEPNMPKEKYVVFETSMGDITCVLYEKDAPITVSNFIGLAAGKKAWMDPTTKEMSKSPLYDNTILHRVIPDFMIQGGDPLGMGYGGPGYQFEDEIVSHRTFEGPGRLAMANSGPNTNGSQFFITVVPTPWLNGKHTIFGQVIDGQEIVDAITKVEKDANNKPVDPVVLKKVIIKDKP